MNALDLAFVTIILVSALYGTWKGFVRDVFSLAGLVGGFLVAFQFHSVPAQWLKTWLSTPLIANIVGWFIIFMLTYLTTLLLGRMLWGSLKTLRLGWLDRLAGLAFGFLKGILLCAGIIVILVAFLPNRTPLLSGSLLVPYVIGISWELGSKVPGHLGERFRTGDPPLTGIEKAKEKE